VPVPEGWDEGAAIEACPVVAWEGRVWRMHKRKYAATNPGGARKVSGRYNRGLDRFPEAESFPALYLATGPEVCLGEVYRHVTPKLLPSLNDYRLSELSVRVGGRPRLQRPRALGAALR
jgi:RES domain-containing protein